MSRRLDAAGKSINDQIPSSRALDPMKMLPTDSAVPACLMQCSVDPIYSTSCDV